uniref:Multiple epidermal growth factor-like domains 10 n=1 Tax=Magallana gigas TaxID=29159 RepID=A0A8W8NT92_MAGGI
MSGAPFPNTNWTSDKVVDGNSNQTAAEGSCAIMDFDQNYQSVWLKVQLGRRFNVAYIELYLRNEHLLGRSSGFSIYAFYDDTFDPASLSPNDFAYHHDPLSGCPTPVQNITINRLVRQIVFINNRPDGFQTNCPERNNSRYTSIEICEIKVMVCVDHYYGIDCNTPCGKCKNNSVCNKGTGHCPNGCQNHWTGNKCDVCVDHYYGIDCNTPCGKCKNNSVCNKGTGHCPNGCQNHWTGNKCDVCSEYIYGTDCNTPCGHCKDKDVCDNTTGHCPNGCQNQWTGDRCEECVPYKYGPNCAFDCGHCKDGKSCVAKTGVCTDGCESGWIGDLCIKENKLITTGVAIIASVSTLFAISLFVIFFMARHIMKNKSKRHHNNEYVPKNEKPHQTYVDLSTVDDNHAYSTLGSTVPETPYNVIGN